MSLRKFSLNILHLWLWLHWLIAVIIKRWNRSRSIKVIALIVILFYSALICLHDSLERDLTRRYIENKIQETLKIDKGTGCEMPHLDPFAEEVMQFEEEVPNILCNGKDWVRCYLSECRVDEEILKTTNDIVCRYRDIIYESDFNYSFGPVTSVYNDDVYVLIRSDHVKVECTGKHVEKVLPSKWTGQLIGFRKSVVRVPPSGREKTINVLMFGFDSTSRNGFIRRMPKTYEYLTKELGATVLTGYNIVGDATPAALIPILTGKTELELPDVRRYSTNKETMDNLPFIFYKLHEDGYRTAFFEDRPYNGAFQFRFKGFKRQPTDHYPRAYFLEEAKSHPNNSEFCVGDTLTYKVMTNITEQFFKLPGKRFAFTFINDISHDNFNLISISDDNTARFLAQFRASGCLDDTLFIMMGDHGARYAKVRATLQGKFEERMPLMAIRIPEVLKRRRPNIEAVLLNNSVVLTTPHDIHATLLDAIDMKRFMNDYRIPGADFSRGLSLFEPIPKNRSCSEAGIEPHWCACVAWDNLSTTDAIYRRVAEAFVNYINQLTDSVRSKCISRTLSSITWVMRRRVNSRLLAFESGFGVDVYFGKFNFNNQINKDYYQVQVVVGPGHGVYEASAEYLKNEDKLVFDERDISRTNAYNNEPECISKTHPHLNMYCYCV